MKKTTTSKRGGRRQALSARLDLLPVEGLVAAGEAMSEGEAKYGRLDESPTEPNWHALDVASDQSPISHAIHHLALYAAGDTSEDHLGHALANLMIQAWFERSDHSPYRGMTYPEMLSGA